MAKQAVDDQRHRVRQAFGERLRHARELVGLTQREVAQCLGLTPLSVMHYEAGRTPFPTDLLPALASLGMDGSWVGTGLPSLEHKGTREQFASVLNWLRREAAIHDLSISHVQELDVAWYAFRRLIRTQSPGAIAGDLEIAGAVQESLAEIANAGQ